MIKLKYLVVGTGRCGTVFTARLLTSLGISCGHESIFTNGGYKHAFDILKGNKSPQLSIISQFNVLNDQRIQKWIDISDIKAESSYLAVPFLNYPAVKNVSLIHIVRNPLYVVDSFVRDFRYFETSDIKKLCPWQKFIYYHLPELHQISNQLERACYYYVKWNQMIEASFHLNRQSMFARIEDMPTKQFFDFTYTLKTDTMYHNYLINTAKRSEHDLQLSDIPNGDIKNSFVAMMNRYGYSNRILSANNVMML